MSRATFYRRARPGAPAGLGGVRGSIAPRSDHRTPPRSANSHTLAKARGKYVQAPKLSATDVEQAQAMIGMGIPKAEVARTFGVSRQTLYTSLARMRL